MNKSKLAVVAFFTSISVFAAEPRYSLGLSYVMGPKVNLNNDELTVGPINEVAYNFEGTVGIEGEARFLSQNSFGFILGLNYEVSTDVKSMTIKSGSTTTEINLPAGTKPSKLQFTFIKASVAYKWENFYIPVGLNYGFLNFTDISTASDPASGKGGLGGQFGIGYEFNDFLAGEFFTKMNSVSFKNSVDSSSGYYTSADLTIKYLF